MHDPAGATVLNHAELAQKTLYPKACFPGIAKLFLNSGGAQSAINLLFLPTT
jgi:hypothetical protein